MIKFLAALFMLIDHIGIFIFPDNVLLRILGRVSMPLFAYSVSRGVYYTNKKHTLNKYITRLSLFSVFSQIPYFTTMKFTGYKPTALNIGFTWLLGVILLLCIIKITSVDMPPHQRLPYLLVFFVCISLPLVLDISYGISGVLYPVLFYWTCFRNEETAKGNLNFGNLILCVTILSVIYIVQSRWIIQIFAIVSVPILIYAKKYDDKIKLPKAFFYIFYPLHISLLLILRYVINIL